MTWAKRLLMATSHVAGIKNAQGLLKMRNMRLEVPSPEKIDWLAYAIGTIGGKGGVPAAAEKLGVEKQTIYQWLDRGIGHLTFNQVDDLATRSGIPVEVLRSRRGPYDYSDDLEDDDGGAGEQG